MKPAFLMVEIAVDLTSIQIGAQNAYALKEEEEGAVVELQHLLELQLEAADIHNNLDCTYDGGDCCGSNVNTQYCTVCLCLED